GVIFTVLIAAGAEAMHETVVGADIDDVLALCMCCREVAVGCGASVIFRHFGIAAMKLIVKAIRMSPGHRRADKRQAGVDDVAEHVIPRPQIAGDFPQRLLRAFPAQPVEPVSALSLAAAILKRFLLGAAKLVPLQRNAFVLIPAQ